jgi:AraC-like DNA-binding protein
MTSGGQRSWSILGEVDSGAGDVIMLNPGEIHDGSPVDGPRSWHIFYLDPALVARELEDETIGELVLRPVAQDTRLANDVVRLVRHLRPPAPDKLAIEELLMCCLMRASQLHGVDGPIGERRSPPVTKALQRLEDAPELPVSLGELAELSNLSRFQLLRGFSREIGTTPHAYLVQLRVRLARRLLALGKRPADAAQLAGFADQSHLNRAFVRQFGITPGRYQAAVG